MPNLNFSGWEGANSEIVSFPVYAIILMVFIGKFFKCSDRNREV